MAHAKAFLAWLAAVLKVWWGWAPSSSIAAFLGFSQNIIGWSAPRGLWVTILVAGFVYSAFTAWRKEWVENRNGPQVVMEWNSLFFSTIRGRSHDVIKFRNVSRSSAFNLQMGDFSWPELRWVFPLQLQAIHPDQEIEVEPHFGEQTDSGTVNVGYLRNIFSGQSREHQEPLTVPVSFSDVNRTQFIRTFILRPEFDGVSVELGELRIKRP